MESIKVGERYYHKNNDFDVIVIDRKVPKFTKKTCVYVRVISGPEKGWEFEAYISLLIHKPWTKLERALK